KKQDVDVVKNYVIQSDSLNLSVANNDLDEYISNLPDDSYSNLLSAVPLNDEMKLDKGWDLFKHKIPMWIFIFVCLTLTVLSVTKNLSLIPVLGVLSCLYMMAQIELKNWIGFTIWLIAGLVIYFSYGYKNSKLNKGRVV
ncbi:MAG TPA: amino acid permease C-terminal domain-containing protein, partial [Bacteroidia bacterium]|nr:amino acid permease C-terminal domain-containing protein [Bacteroidia bacterium]